MKILHVVPSYKPAYVYGGPIVSVSQLCESQAAFGHEVIVFTTTANGASELDIDPGSTKLVDGVNVTYFRRITGDHTHVSPALWKHLWKTCKSYDVIHLHSWWSPLMIMVAYICSSRGKRPILAPRGMLGKYTFGSTHSPMKKLIHFIVGKRLLRSTILHATTKMELGECLEIIPSWPNFVLPNIVSLPEREFERRNNKVFTIGFLSRIDAKKGIELAMEALSQVSFSYVFKIAGTGEVAYMESLKQKAEALGIDQHVEWCGWKSGDEKFEFLAGCDLFLLTSYNENFANVVIEALSVSTPVLVSDKVGLYDYVQQSGMGWVTSLDTPDIVQKLHEVVGDMEKREKIIIDAAVSVRKDFNSLQLGSQYIKAYSK